MAKNKLHFVTADYTVQVTDTNSSNRSDFTHEQLSETHEQFLSFRRGLYARGLLPEGENESNEVTFAQDKIGSRTMFFRIEPFAEFVADSYGIALEDYNHASRPDMHLFQAHLQKPTVYGLPLTRISHMYPKQLSQTEPSKFTINIDGKMEEVSMNADGLDYRKTLAVLDVFIAGVSSTLARENIEPSPERILRFWALLRFVEMGYSVAARNTNVKNRALDALVFDLVRLDAPLYTSFLAISQAANPDYRETKEFTYSSKSISELGEIPKTFLRYMILSE